MVQAGSWLLTLWDNIFFPSSRVKYFKKKTMDCWSLKQGTIYYPTTLETNYQPASRNVTEERRHPNSKYEVLLIVTGRIFEREETSWTCTSRQEHGWCLTFWGPCIMIHLCNGRQQDALFLNFILINNSACFRQPYCPSSGVLILYSQQLVFVTLVCCLFASEVRIELHSDLASRQSAYPYDKYQLLRTQYQDSWWWTISLSEICRDVH